MKEFNDFIQIINQDPLAAVFLILNIILLEVVLSFDNAAVLATMVKDLPHKQQEKALRYGILGAYLFRGLALAFAQAILDIWWLKPIGGLYLLYMCISFFMKKAAEDEGPQKETKDTFVYRYTIGLFGVFWSTVIAVEFMDIVFSIDNIFAVVAFSDNLILICLGVFIGILAMRYVARYFVVLMEKFPFVETCAFIVIGLLGIKLCLALLVHYVPSTKWIESEDFDLVVSCLTLAVFVVPILFARIKKGKS
jgi:YkoY family integral membrane protein